jgi:hypothetical protein
MPGGSGSVSSGARCRTSRNDCKFETTCGYFQMCLNISSSPCSYVLCLPLTAFFLSCQVFRECTTITNSIQRCDVWYIRKCSYTVAGQCCFHTIPPPNGFIRCKLHEKTCAVSSAPKYVARTLCSRCPRSWYLCRPDSDNWRKMITAGGDCVDCHIGEWIGECRPFDPQTCGERYPS